jgi:CrcB protein
MMQLLLIGIGGGAGSILRYICQRQWNDNNIPYGTLVVNIIGCFVIGLLAGFVSKNAISDSLKMLLMTGVCGGFTTFSAFTLEGNGLLQQGRFFYFIIYTALSVAGGLFVTFLGYKLIS